MSHHHDSLLARQDPRLDVSDLYVFRGDRGTVFVLNVNPLSGTGGFHDDESLYEIKIDTDGDGVEDITYRFTFAPIAFAPFSTRGSQRWELRRFDGAAARDRDAAGTVLLRGVTEEPSELVRPAGGGPEGEADGALRAWAGQAGDPFWIEGTVVTAVKTALAEGTAPELADFDPRQAKNLFADTDVQAIVLEVPDADLAGAQEIGVWGVSVLATDAGGWRQINRCATPLLNTLFVLEDADRHIDFNATVPGEDRERYGAEVQAAIERGAAAVGAVTDPAAHAAHVRDLLLPDVLRYEVGSKAHFGWEQRNGRALTDCTPEAVFALILGAPVSMGLDASAATGVPRDVFPYLAPSKAER